SVGGRSRRSFAETDQENGGSDRGGEVFSGRGQVDLRTRAASQNRGSKSSPGQALYDSNRLRSFGSVQRLAGQTRVGISQIRCWDSFGVCRNGRLQPNDLHRRR